MVDKNDDDSDHGDISETDHESLQTCSNNSYLYRTAMSVHIPLAIRALQYLILALSKVTCLFRLMTHRDNDNSEINYKSSKLSGHSNFGDSKRTSKSIFEFTVDEKDHPQSIKDTVD